MIRTERKRKVESLHKSFLKDLIETSWYLLINDE